MASTAVEKKILSDIALTRTEKIMLEERGYSKADIQEINLSIKKSSYALVTERGEKLTIGPLEALERLGREEWIKGVCRAAFYVDTTRYGLNGERIAIHAEIYS